MTTLNNVAGIFLCRVFFRQHFHMKSILYCGIDPSDKRYDQANLSCLSICHATKKIRHAKYSLSRKLRK